MNKYLDALNYLRNSVVVTDHKQKERVNQCTAVLQELRNMKGWCSANPERRKTKRGILRFIVGWLSREQDKPKVNKKVPEWFNQTSDESVKDVDDAEIENMQRLLGGK